MTMYRFAGSFALLLLVACAGGTAQDPDSPRDSPGVAPNPLAQVDRWALRGATDAAGQPIAAAMPHGRPTHALVFKGDRVAVEGGCNHIGGRYRIEDDGRLRVLQMESTLMACEDQALMAADAAVSGLLEGVAQWRIAESYPEQLTLDHADGGSSHWVAVRPPQ